MKRSAGFGSRGNLWHVAALVGLAACGSSDAESGGQTGGSGGKSSINLVPVPHEEDEYPVAASGGLAPTPPMGWNSWNAYASNVTAELIMKAADVLVESGMRDAGYVYVNIDDGWAQRTRTVVASGEGGATESVIEANPKAFPPGPNGEPGIQVVADYVHSKGLKLGIYSDRGTATCAGFAASGGYEERDARTFADWGVDYLKYDSCFASTEPDIREAEYRAMSVALRALERPIVFSLCSWQFDEWNAEAGELWRTTSDIAKSFSDITAVTPPSRTVLQNANGNAAYAAYSGPNRWNDPDMLEVGNLGTSALANTESQTHFNLWAIMAAPLIAGHELDGMTEATRRILTNPRVIAVNQDPLGIQGVIVRATEATSVWAKPLNASGARAVLFMNADTVPQTVTVNLADIGLGPGRATRRDLWDEADTGVTFDDTFSAEVPGHGSMMYEILGTEPGIPRGTVSLGDVPWTYAANALGPVERNRSNGGRAAGDGKPLSLRGQMYEKGLGVAAGSKISFRLAKRCSAFSAVVGVDDETNGAGSVVFEVWADGEKLYPSGPSQTLTGKDAPQTLEVDLTGKHRLTLLTTSAGDGPGNDHADWAEAKLTCAP